MEKPQLIHAIASILKQTPGIRDPEALASRLATDEMLLILQADMWPVCVLNSSGSIARESVQAERGGEIIMPKIWPFPAVCVGEVTEKTGTTGTLTHETGIETYIDERGSVFLASFYGIRDEDLDVTIRKQTRGSMYRLNRITDLAPYDLRARLEGLL